MPTPFSEAFVALRREAGFETAYQFFHKNGGRRVLQCSFPNYLRVEKGSNLPKPARLPVLFSLLRLPLHSAERRELLRAYLKTWARSGELGDWLVSSLTAQGPVPRPADPAAAALRKLVRGAARPLGLKQYEVVMASEASYWAYRMLVGSREPQAEAELARRAGLSAAALRRGLEGLKKTGLARKEKDGRWSSPLAGEFLVFPDPSVIPPALMRRVFGYNRRMVARRGSLVDERYCGVRADGLALQGYLPHLREALRSVNAYATAERTPHSALYFVEARVFKLFDF